MTKNLILDPILAYMAEIWGPILFREIYFY